MIGGIVSQMLLVFAEPVSLVHQKAAWKPSPIQPTYGAATARRQNPSANKADD